MDTYTHWGRFQLLNLDLPSRDHVYAGDIETNSVMLSDNGKHLTFKKNVFTGLQANFRARLKQKKTI